MTRESTLTTRIGQPPSRRRFLAGTLAAMADTQIVPASALGRGNQQAPSERITIGMFGMGNRGSSSLSAIRLLPDHQTGGKEYPAVPPCDPPEGFDYDMWTGPAPFSVLPVRQETV